jgi:hypothetical protein
MQVIEIRGHGAGPVGFPSHLGAARPSATLYALA